MPGFISMVKTITFDKSCRIYDTNNYSSLFFYDIDGDYKLSLNNKLNSKNESINKCLFIRENHFTIFSYEFKNNLYTYNNFKSSCPNITNDEILTESIKLGAYKSNITNKRIPNRMINKAYELLIMMSNNQEFEVISNEESVVRFNEQSI